MLTGPVVLVTTLFPSVSETFVVRHALELLDLGVDVHIVCSRELRQVWSYYPGLRERLRGRIHVASARPRGLREVAGTVAGIAGAALQAPGALIRDLVASRPTTLHVLARSLLQDWPILQLRPAVIHFEFGALAVGRTHLKPATKARLTASFRGHDIDYVALDDTTYYAELFGQLDGVHFLSNYLLKRARSRGLPGSALVRIIAPAVDLASFAGHDRPHAVPAVAAEQPLRLLAVSRLHWTKGLAYLLHAVRRVIDSSVPCQLRIAGDGDQVTAVRYAVSELELDRHVELLGSCTSAELAEHYRWADVFVHAAVSEGFCNAVLEAQAAGLAVVTSDAGGLPENVVDQVTGFVVPRRDPDQLAARIVELARDPELRWRLGAQGRQRVQDQFSRQREQDQFREFFAAVVAQPRESRGAKGIDCARRPG
jgi:colanic acid/amylovoran biosynthesis glycosyltransferase